MSQRLRRTALSFVWAFAGCQRNGPPSTPPSESSSEGEPEVIAELDGVSTGTLPITPVVQVRAFVYDDWRFEPGGERLASTENGDCSVWDVESGRLIRSFELDPNEPEPEACSAWPETVDFSEFQSDFYSADETLEVDYSGNKLTISEVESGKQLHTIPCPKCDEAQISWSREGHTLALAWQEDGRLEVWNADKGKQLRREELPISGEVDEFELGWTAGGATVAWVESEIGSCDYDYDYDCYYNDEGEHVQTSYSTQIAVSSKQDLLLTYADQASSIGELSFDAEGHWAIWVYSYSARREGSRDELHVEGLAGYASELGWTYEDDYGYYDGYSDAYVGWRNDGAIHWGGSHHNSSNDGYTSVEWESIQVSPPLGRRTGTILSEVNYDSEIWIDTFGFVDNKLSIIGEACEESCDRVGLVPPGGCTHLDVASGHGTELFDCDGSALLRSSHGPSQLPINSENAEWWWSHGGALAIYDGNSFVLAHAIAGQVAPPRKDVLGVLDAKLGLELERLVLITARGVELIELDTGKVLLTLDKLEPLDAALSPKGERLALLQDGKLRVFDVATKQELFNAPAQGTSLAYRQDGKIIYTGEDWPEAAYDANTGEPSKSPVLERVIAATDEGGDPDPSWRWLMNRETHELTRTLDGRTINIAEGQVWLEDTGQYAGQPPAEIAFRVGDDPWSVPVYDAESLARWLKMPKLFEAFVTGETIPKPMVEAAQLRALEAKLEAKDKD